jgi:3-phosphoshikimate 1-carboxyvinyltransferase
MDAFPKNGGTFQIEPDASSGSYFWAAGWIQSHAPIPSPNVGTLFSSKKREGFSQKMDAVFETASSVSVLNWPKTQWQIDQNFPRFHIMPKSHLISRATQLGDSIMTRIVVTPFLNREIEFTDLGRLRVQECERVVALRTELTKCGAKVVEEGDTLTVYPSKPEELHGAEIETYNDHRMAMCFAVLGLKVPGIKIKNPACVKKTFPNFFQKLAGAPPHGLGAEIWEIKNGQRTRKLSGQDLFAD